MAAFETPLGGIQALAILPAQKIFRNLDSVPFTSVPAKTCIRAHHSFQSSVPIVLLLSFSDEGELKRMRPGSPVVTGAGEPGR